MYSIGSEEVTVGASGESTFVDGINYFKSLVEIDDANLPFMVNGLFGYSCFESVELMEQIRFEEKHTEKEIPLAQYAMYEYVLVFDHFKNDLCLIRFTKKADQTIPDSLINKLFNGHVPNYPFHAREEEESVYTDDEFEELVRTGIGHCKRGDVFQLVLSREFSQKFQGDDFKVYRALRHVNPSPYLFFFDYGDFKLMGSSPEAQIIVKKGIAEIHPIAGTFRRTGIQEADQSLAEELKNDPKESAEHVMLVDLARNDLNKHGTDVEVKEYAEIQYFSHVIHMVSKVTANVMPENAVATYADTFPAGTLSGAPKYKAMQLIDSYEPVSRSFYGGSIGFIGFDGTINQAIMIRSILSKNQTLYYQAGAGVVVHSKPASETQEVHNKVAALRKAIQKAEKI